MESALPHANEGRVNIHQASMLSGKHSKDMQNTKNHNGWTIYYPAIMGKIFQRRLYNRFGHLSMQFCYFEISFGQTIMDSKLLLVSLYLRKDNMLFNQVT